MYRKGRDALKQLDKVLRDLRAEARIGHGSHEVRRHWIRAELAAARQARQEALSSSVSKPRGSANKHDDILNETNHSHSVHDDLGLCTQTSTTTGQDPWLDGCFDADELGRIILTGSRSDSKINCTHEESKSVDVTRVLAHMQQRRASEYAHLCRVAENIPATPGYEQSSGHTIKTEKTDCSTITSPDEMIADPIDKSCVSRGMQCGLLSSVTPMATRICCTACYVSYEPEVCASPCQTDSQTSDADKSNNTRNGQDENTDMCTSSKALRCETQQKCVLVTSKCPRCCHRASVVASGTKVAASTTAAAGREQKALCASCHAVSDDSVVGKNGLTISAMQSRVAGWRQSLRGVYWTVLNEAVFDEADLKRTT